MQQSNQTSSSSFTQLSKLVDSCPRRRFSFDAAGANLTSFIVAGPMSAWAQAAQFLRSRGKEIVAYYDVDGRSKRETFEDRPVIRSADLGRFPDVPRLFAGEAIKGWFNHARPGLQECVWQVQLSAWQQRGYHQARILHEHQDSLGRLFGLLVDEDSRQTLASIVRSRTEGDVGYMRVASYPEYLHPTVHAEDGDIVIDAGAYVGDSAKIFSPAVGARGRVLSFEPSQVNYLKLVEAANAADNANIIPICSGIWNKPTVLSFDENKPGAASFAISETGATKIPVTSVDRTVALYSLPRVDLLKLDIEGAEAQAIEGAQQTLQRFRPKVQVSIYHHSNDLFDLPARITKLLPDYSYFLGHHSHYHMETDLYGIPNERLRAGAGRA